MSLQFGGHKRTDIMQIASDGQSLGCGVASIPPISTSQPYSNVTFASGVLTRPKDAGYDASYFRPMVESQLLAGPDNLEGDLGETPVSGCCNGLVRRLVQIHERPEDWVMLGQRSGQSGQSVEAASVGGASGTYEAMLQSIDDGHALALASGKSYSFWAHLWIQGEANTKTVRNGETRNPTEYADRVLRQDQQLADYIESRGYQDFRHALVLYQTAAHRWYDIDCLGIANAQLSIARENDHAILASPVYFMPRAEDGLHLTNEGSWLLGEYLGRAIYETCIVPGDKWRPLEPTRVEWNLLHIDIHFHVPSSRLVLDDALCSIVPTGLFGFDIRENGLVVAIIKAVSVVARDVVRIWLHRPAADNALLSYARGRIGDPQTSGPENGPRGNLRDTHGDIDRVVSPIGNTFHLHNACVAFENHRVYGFSIAAIEAAGLRVSP